MPIQFICEQQIIMHDLKPYSRSLKHILTENIIQSSNLNSFLKQSKSSHSTTEVSIIKLQTRRNNGERSLSGPITPLKLKTNDVYDANKSTNIITFYPISKDNESAAINKNSFLPKRHRSTSQKQIYSKFQQSIDKVMNQIIKRQKLPILHEGKGLPVSKKIYRNIRISTETEDSQNPCHNFSRSYENNHYLGTTTVNLMRIKQKIKQNLKKQKIVDQQCFFVPSRINTHLDLSKAAKKAKEVLSYYPLSRYRQQQQSVSPSKIIDCYQHLRHFREDKMPKKLQLHKS